MAAVLATSGCRSWTETTVSDKVYSVHGTGMHVVTIDRYSGGFNEKIERVFLLDDGQRPPLALNDQVFALQRDGSFKRVDCCRGVYPASSSILEIDGKLIFVLVDSRRHVTNCRAYPPGHPDDESAAPGDRYVWVTYFGEFDPERRRFFISDFLPEDVTLPRNEAFNAAWEELRRTRQYRARRRFQC